MFHPDKEYNDFNTSDIITRKITVILTPHYPVI